jgi:TPR repeat protein
MFQCILGALALLLVHAAGQPADDGLAPSDPGAMAGAEAANPEALFQRALRRMENLSLTGTPDPVEVDAIRDMLSRAADQGHGGALNMLGTIASSDGSGDMAPAIAFFERAHAAGDASGTVNLGVALLHAGTHAEQQRGIDILRDFLARDGLDETLSGLASGYLGYAVSAGAGGRAVDYDQGLELLLLGHAADPENVDFNYMLGRHYESGTAIPADPAAAAQYFIAAGEAGHAIAAWRAGMAYLNGEGVEANPLEAFRFVNISARNGYDRGMISLAVMNALGQGIPVNGDQAMEWYGHAAALGNAHAMRGLGLMLLLGEAGEADPVTGYALLSMAAGAGDAIAVQALDQLAPQIPDTPDWTEAVEEARAGFLETNNLTQAELYGAEP